MSNSIVLMFHEIHDQIWFEEILRYLGKSYKFVDFDELCDRINTKQLKDRVAHITFDDGHSSLYEAAYPIMNKLHIPSTLFVSPLIVEHQTNYWFQRVRPLRSEAFRQFLYERCKSYFTGSINLYSIHAVLKSLPYPIIRDIIEEYEVKHPNLVQPYINVTRNQLVEMSNSGIVEIGAHTLNHPILANEGEEDFTQEILLSINELSRLIKKKVKTFAYPNGYPGIDFGYREMNLLRKHDISLSFSTLSSCIEDDSDTMGIPRIGVSKGSPFYVTQKIRFAKQWISMRNLVLGKSEIKERKQILRIRRQTHRGVV